jgi:hypothetical protein
MSSHVQSPCGRMRDRIFVVSRTVGRIFRTMSLLFLLLVLWLWVRSYFAWDSINQVRAGGEIGFGSACGRFTMWWGASGGGDLKWYWITHRPPAEERAAWSGFDGGRIMNLLWVGVPYWFLALLALAPPVYALARSRRRRRHAQHPVCAACGYDLRATPDRCPECGTPAAHEPRTTLRAAVP